MKYRKKPVVIEAFKWLTDEVPVWWKERKDITIHIPTGSAFIPTLEGTHEAKKGDFIIQGIKGEIYSVKPDIFEMTYEPILSQGKLTRLFLCKDSKSFHAGKEE